MTTKRIETKRKVSARDLVVEMLQKNNVGPIFQNTNSEIFRLAVGSFFASMDIGEYQAMIEKQADEILANAKKGETNGAKRAKKH